MISYSAFDLQCIKIYDFAHSLGENLIFQRNFNFFNVKIILISFASVVGNIADT